MLMLLHLVTEGRSLWDLLMLSIKTESGDAPSLWTLCFLSVNSCQGRAGAAVLILLSHRNRIKTPTRS